MKARLLISVVIVLSALVSEALTAPAPKAVQPDKNENPKTVKFAMKDKSWREVFEWLSDATGKTVQTKSYPPGKFTFEGPADKEYTIGEVMDIVNEKLLSKDQKQIYLLIQRECSFMLVPADEKIDTKVLQRIRPNELAERGDSELVCIVLPLNVLDAEEVVAQIKKMMGPFSEAVAVKEKGVNQLILSDTPENLKLICKMLEEVEKDIQNPAPPRPWQPGDPRFLGGRPPSGGH